MLPFAAAMLAARRRSPSTLAKTSCSEILRTCGDFFVPAANGGATPVEHLPRVDGGTVDAVTGTEVTHGSH
jgi:hypothetical protein